ncbi:MAG: PAS domain-containing protein [Clostridia bacterium]|nr:PAS domain-containing protein [Clostridia bacterium]
MINYYAAYSTQAMLMIAAAIACVILGAFLCAYLFVKAEKSLLLWVVIVELTVFLTLPVLGVMSLVSPTLELRNLYIASQRFAALLAAALLLCIFSWMHRHGGRLMHYSAYALVFLTNIFCIYCLFENKSVILQGFVNVVDFAVFIFFLLLTRQHLFVELSPVSIDNFMNELDHDIILIFEKSGKLIDANSLARKSWAFLQDGLAINDFFISLNKHTVSKKFIEKNGLLQHEEVAIKSFDGIRHYQYSLCEVKDKKGAIQATVLIFHDITEKTVLEGELKAKNEQLEKTNIKLNAFLDTSERLLEEEQKEKAAKDLKEVLSVKIEKLFSEIEAVSFDNKNDKLPNLIDKCREIMSGIRLAMQKLIQDGRRDEENA